MRVDKDHKKDMGGVRIRNFLQFSRNGFWMNISCIFLRIHSVLGGVYHVRSRKKNIRED